MDRYFILIQDLEVTLKKLEETLKNKMAEREKAINDDYTMHKNSSNLEGQLSGIKRTIEALEEIRNKNSFLFSFKLVMKGLFGTFKSGNLLCKLAMIMLLLLYLSAIVLIPDLGLNILGILFACIFGLTSLCAFANYKYKKNNDMTTLLSDEKRITEEIEAIQKQIIENKERISVLDKEIESLIQKKEFYESVLTNLKLARSNALERLVPEEVINQAFEQEIKENEDLRLSLERIKKEGEK